MCLISDEDAGFHTKQRTNECDQIYSLRLPFCERERAFGISIINISAAIRLYETYNLDIQPHSKLHLNAVR